VALAYSIAIRRSCWRSVSRFKPLTSLELPNDENGTGVAFDFEGGQINAVVIGILPTTLTIVIHERADRSFSELENPTGQKSEPLPSEKPSNPRTLGNEILDHISSLPDIGPADGREVFFKLVEEFPIIERLKKLELIDVVIDRTIKRFLQVKTMKQMFRQAEPKTISISPKRKISAV
jgi:hypothetical protein